MPMGEKGVIQAGMASKIRGQMGTDMPLESRLPVD